MATQNSIDTNKPIEVTKGGTGVNTLLNHGVLLGSGNAAITALAVGVTNQVLLGATAADPTWGAVDLTAAVTGTLPVANGGTGAVTLTDHGVMIGSGVGAVTILAEAATGSTLMGNTGADPSFTGSPSFSGSVTAGTTIEATTTITAGTGLTITTGDATVTAGNLNLPVTNGTGTEGVIEFGGTRWISNYGTRNTFVGPGSGNTSLTVGNAVENVAVGYHAVDALTTGEKNVGVGPYALSACTEGIRNSAIGHLSLAALTTGDYNCGFGNYTLQQTTTGSYNCAFGHNAGNGTTLTDSDNICIMNIGTAGDNNTLRLGTQGTGNGQIDKSFIAGIYNTTPAGGVDQAVIIDSNGQLGASNELVLANQPAFLAYLGANVANATGNGNVWQLGTTTALTEVTDQGADFNTNGTFTAPVTAMYQLNATITLDAISAATIGNINIITSNRSYRGFNCSPTAVQDSGDMVTFTLSVLADMDAADTAYVTVYALGEGADNLTVFGGATLYSHFSGYLAC